MVIAQLDPEINDPHARTAHDFAAQIYEALGDERRALAEWKIFQRLVDQNDEEIASNRAALLAAQFQFDAQNAQIEKMRVLQVERDARAQARIAQLTMVGTAILTMLLIAMLILAMRARNRAQADGRTLATLNADLELALAAKTNFLASTSHEIRTPLNGILGMAQVMLADTALPARNRAQIEVVHDAGTTMRALVDDILDVAKIEHGGFTINARAVRPAELTRRVVSLFAERAMTRGVVLSHAIDLPDVAILIDPDRLTQILFNLIGNALKFTQAGTITVTLERRGEMLELRVRDTGTGIPIAWQRTIFEPFRQVETARARSSGGTGLGLAICRNLARAMGGEVTLESVEDSGSCFTVTLPWQLAVEAAATDATTGSEAGPAGTAPPRVRVLAADPMRRAMLAAVASRAGWTVDSPDGGPATVVLADAAALAYADRALDDSGGSIDHIIIAGSLGEDGDGDFASLAKHGVTVVTFARNDIIAALDGARHRFYGATAQMKAGDRMNEAGDTGQNDSAQDDSGGADRGVGNSAHTRAQKGARDSARNLYAGRAGRYG